MHSVIYNYCPKSYVNIWKHNNERNEIHNRSLRNSDELEITHPRLELYKKSPIYSLPKLWNELDDTRFQHCRTTFSISIKDKLLKDPIFFSKNHTRSQGVASGTICTNIHVLTVLVSILLISAVFPRKAPRPSLPFAPLPAGGRYAPTKISLDIPN
jgi:hypothetical protein